MKSSELKVAATTQSYADTLVAVGLASLMQEYQDNYRGKHDLVEDIVIEKEGDAYLIKIDLPLEVEKIKDWTPPPGYKYPQFKKIDVPPSTVDVFDYESEVQKAKIYGEYRRNISGKDKKIKKAAEEQGVESAEPPKPNPLLNLYRTINSLRMGSNSVSNLYRYIYENKDKLGSLIVVKLADYGFQARENGKDVTKDTGISSLQLFNPLAGKGINRPKPDGVSAGPLSSKLTDWFGEWMKYRAMEKCMLTYVTADKDTKIFVISPSNISIKNLDNICHGIRTTSAINLNSKGGALLDILAVIGLAEILIKKSEFKDGDVPLKGYRLSEIIEGINTAYFKNMGNASAITNISFLGLPGWFPIESARDVEDWLEILDEHRSCVRGLDESKSGDMQILLQYRDFISSGQLKDFLKFLALYVVRLMQSIANKERFPLKAFTTKNLWRVFMGFNLQEIIENQGFKNIATAIRKSTINLQIRKSIGQKPPFDIRYGLAQDWKRKARTKEQFIKELAEFVQQYNAENARNMELHKETRTNIETKDLEQIISLIKDNNSSELVAMLLLAYGYARVTEEEEN